MKRLQRENESLQSIVTEWKPLQPRPQRQPHKVSAVKMNAVGSKSVNYVIKLTERDQSIDDLRIKIDEYRTREHTITEEYEGKLQTLTKI